MLKELMEDWFLYSEKVNCCLSVFLLKMFTDE